MVGRACQTVGLKTDKRINISPQNQGVAIRERRPEKSGLTVKLKPAEAGFSNVGTAPCVAPLLLGPRQEPG